MHAKLVRIGHSRGIRIPRALIEMAELTEDLELYASPGELIVRVAGFHPRRGWAEAAAQMGPQSDLMATPEAWPSTRSRRRTPRAPRKKADR